MDSDNDLTLLDVRTAAEYEFERVGGTKLRIGYQEIADVIDRRQFPPDKAVYLYCRVGRRSMIAAKSLERAGYSHLINVVGGITAWKAAGFPTIKQ